jgi:YbbR domain-containing protein
MKKILTKPVDLNGLSESFKKEIALDLAEEIEAIAPAKIVQAEILIAEAIAIRNYNDISVIGKGTPYTYEITPPKINIKVRGPLNVLEKLDAENGIEVYVELKGLAPGMYVRRATITLPVKTALIGVKPEIFTVNIIGSSPKKLE